MPSGRLHRVEEPGASGTSGISGGAFARPPGASFANLAVTFCDTLTPEWNVLHLLAAMEKINAELVIVAGKTEGPYAEACAEQAATNPRVRFRMYEPGGFTAIAGEVGSLLARASIVVDPSIGGMGGGVVAAAADAGVPSVISRCSARVLPARTGADRVSGYHLARESVFTFEPTSWELLNHAVICAFNAAAGIHAGPASGSASGPAVDLPDHPSRNAAIAGTQRELYRETAARG
jgi:glycosyltransferase involved in cell wall biosynthesis